MGWLVLLYVAVAVFLQYRTRRRGLLWISYVVAVLGGCTMAYYTSVGHHLSGLGRGPAIFLTVLGLVLIVCDLADKKPEKLAVFVTLVLPSLALGVGGAVGGGLHGLFGFVASFGGTLGSTGLGA